MKHHEKLEKYIFHFFCCFSLSKGGEYTARAARRVDSHFSVDRTFRAPRLQLESNFFFDLNFPNSWRPLTPGIPNGLLNMGLNNSRGA
jgi:hypothetical protein